MTWQGWFQILIYVALLTALTPLLGGYMARVYMGRRVVLQRVLGPVERGFYAAVRTNPDREQDWKQYATTVLVFSALFWLALYAILRLQGALLFNPLRFGGAPWNVTRSARPRCCAATSGCTASAASSHRSSASSWSTWSSTTCSEPDGLSEQPGCPPEPGPPPPPSPRSAVGFGRAEPTGCGHRARRGGGSYPAPGERSERSRSVAVCGIVLPARRASSRWTTTPSRRRTVTRPTLLSPTTTRARWPSRRT
jgi:Potassium-transporting ATPase A subunit